MNWVKSQTRVGNIVRYAQCTDPMEGLRLREIPANRFLVLCRPKPSPTATTPLRSKLFPKPRSWICVVSGFRNWMEP